MADDVLTLRSKREPQEQSAWETFKQILKACGLLCYTACPPIPEQITRKLAFHPPPRGKTYQLRLLDGSTNTLFKKASKVHGKPFKIEIMEQTHAMASSQRHLFEETTYFTVETSQKNVLVCLHSTPRNLPSHKRSTNQVVIFAQPNSSDLGWWSLPLSMNIPYLAELLECPVIAFDYSGFGCSTGSPSEANIYSDIAAVFNYVRKKMPDAEIVLLGYSIGTACVIDMASHRPEGLTGVVLIAPFTSGLRLFQGADLLEADQPPSCCISLDRFKSVEKISLIDVPTLICHGTFDTTIPDSHGKALHSKLKHPVPMLLLHGADHATIFTGTHMETMDRIRRFLQHEADSRHGSKRMFVEDLMQHLGNIPNYNLNIPAPAAPYIVESDELFDVNLDSKIIDH